MIKYLITAILLCTQTAMAGGYSTYRSYHKNKAIVVEETVIPLYDTIIVTPHNQFFKVFPDPHISQILKIERLIEPQNFLVQRLEYPINDPIVVEKQVVPYIQRSTVHRYKRHCCK